jgi:hypothetical protein
VSGRRTRGLAAALTAIGVLGGGLTGCEEGAHREIQDEINILTRRNDALVPPATERLARYGRLAIPHIETAMHTAAPTGRLHLVAAFDRIGNGDAIPVLRHFAVYDVRPEVRQACAELLARWAQPSNDGNAATTARAERARAAQAEMARKRAAGEEPMIFDGGTPGAPTVGAPEPVGIDLEKRR